MKYVVDSSVAFKWVVAEPDTDKAIRLRDDFRAGVIDLFAVDIFPTEVANALLVAEWRGRIGSGQAAAFFADIAKTMPQLVSALPDLMSAAIAIGALTHSSVYDSLYVALADREQCELVTADLKLVNRLQAKFPFVVSLASLP